MEKITLIAADQTVLLWAAVLLVVAVSIFLEQRFRWAATISSTILVIVGGFILANIGIVPNSAPVFSSIGGPVLLCSIPLFLFKANVREIVNSTKKMFVLFHIVAVACVVGAIAIFFILRNVENIGFMGVMFAAGEVGGTVNSLAMKEIYGVPDSLFAAAAVTGNICVALLLLFLRTCGNSKFVRSTLKTPHIDALESIGDAEALKKEGKTRSAIFWGGKEIGLKDIATALAVTFLIVGVSQVIASAVVSLNPPMIIRELFGSVYMLMTILTVIAATVFPKFMGGIKGTMELGNIGMLCWFCTIGMSGNLITIIKEGLIFGALWLVVAILEAVVGYFGARALKANWEDVAVCTVAAAGGPPTAAALSVAFGWEKMVIPGMLVGLWGYVIGNYAGIIFAKAAGLIPIL